MILAIVDDLIFLSKIQQAAEVLKIPLETSTPAGAEQRVRTASALLIDLNHRSGAALDVIRRVKSDLAMRHVPVVGFVSHVQGDLAAAARTAGCDRVLARSAFSKQLPQLLEELGGMESDTATRPG
jgi:CheY-like chemotaxis protein